jgi:chromosome segregation ATPase
MTQAGKDPFESLMQPPDLIKECARLKERLAELEAKLAKLVEALQLADATLSGANMNMKVVERKVKAAIAELKGAN